MTPLDRLTQLAEFLLDNYWPSALILFLASWFSMLAIGWWHIERLKSLRGMRWSPREDTPDSHLSKAGTPSMGGAGIIGAALLGYVALSSFIIAIVLVPPRPAGTVALIELWPFLSQGFLFPLTIGLFAVLGLVDDWSKARGRGGLRARQKLAGQVLLAMAFIVTAWWLKRTVSYHPWRFADIWFAPFVPWWLVIDVALILAIVVVATSNAVNLTDGIDGLTAGLAVQCGLVYIWLERGFWLNNDDHYEVAWMWAALAGACLGFLAYNKHPAKVFMGDTGSLALGAALGCAALLTGTVFLLPFVGCVFFLEMFSVVAQVLYFKYTKKHSGEGKRIFRRAPLHHHYELGGWNEWRVVLTFWALNGTTTVIGLLLWSNGCLPRFP